MQQMKTRQVRSIKTVGVQKWISSFKRRMRRFCSLVEARRTGYVSPSLGDGLPTCLCATVWGGYNAPPSSVPRPTFPRADPPRRTAKQRRSSLIQVPLAFVIPLSGSDHLLRAQRSAVPHDRARDGHVPVESKITLSLAK